MDRHKQGGSENPKYRSRLVGQEFRTSKEATLYAATPPLEAVRAILSYAATSDGGGRGEKEVMVNDVSRAYFNAPAKRDLFVELLPEDPKKLHRDGGKIESLPV